MKKSVALWIIALAVFVSAAAVAKDKKPKTRGKWSADSVYKCYRAESEIVIDGSLDEPAWQKADIITGLWQADIWVMSGGKSKKVPGHFETERTVARLLYDDNYIYIGAELSDSDVLGLTSQNDAEFMEGYDDIFEVFFKPDRVQKGYYEFHIMPQNATRDIYFPRYAGDHYMRFVKAYKSGMQTAVKIDGTLNNWRDTDNGWNVEIKIPMSAFEETGGGPKPGDRWQFLISRYNYSFNLPRGLEIVQMVGLGAVDFHQTKTYPTIEFVK